MINGCYEYFKPQLSNMAEYLIMESCNNNDYIRAISCWCLSKLGNFILNENLDNKAESIIQNVISSVSKLLKDDNQEVSNSSISCLTTLVKINKKRIIPYLKKIFFQIEDCLKHSLESEKLEIYSLISFFFNAYKDEITNNQPVFDSLLNILNNKWSNMIEYIIIYYNTSEEIFDEKEEKEMLFKYREFFKSDIYSMNKMNIKLDNDNKVKDKLLILSVMNEMITVNSQYFNNKFFKYINDVLILLGKIRTSNGINRKNNTLDKIDEQVIIKCFNFMITILQTYSLKLEHILKRSEFIPDIFFYSNFKCIKPFCLVLLSELILYSHIEIEMNFNFIVNFLIDSLAISIDSSNSNSSSSENNKNDANLKAQATSDYFIDDLSSKEFGNLHRKFTKNDSKTQDKPQVFYDKYLESNNTQKFDEDTISNCNNAIWALSLIAIKYKTRIEFYITKIMKKIDSLCKLPALELCILQNISILIGRIALFNYKMISAYLDSMTSYFCIGIQGTKDSKEKREAFTGICNSVIFNPAEIINNLAYFLDAMCQYEDAPSSLQLLFQNLILSMKKFLRERWIDYFRIFPIKLRDSLSNRFNVLD